MMLVGLYPVVEYNLDHITSTASSMTTFSMHGWKDSNPRITGLEAAALAAGLHPHVLSIVTPDRYGVKL
jgi:hypothetical protein